METPFCMDLCEEASTDNWRRCLHDCNVGLINEAKRVQERKVASVVSAPKDTTISRALVVLGAIVTLMSVWIIIDKNKKR
jgi:hypothetical protein